MSNTVAIQMLVTSSVLLAVSYAELPLPFTVLFAVLWGAGNMNSLHWFLLTRELRNLADTEQVGDCAVSEARSTRTDGQHGS